MHRTGVARQTVRRHFFILSFSLQGRMRLMNACVWGGGAKEDGDLSDQNRTADQRTTNSLRSQSDVTPSTPQMGGLFRLYYRVAP